MNERVLGIPVSRDLPRKYNDSERVTVTLSLDDDLILRAFGKGATQEQGVRAEYHDLLFARTPRSPLMKSQLQIASNLMPDEPGNTPHYRFMPGDLVAKIYRF